MWAEVKASEEARERAEGETRAATDSRWRILRRLKRFR
jgi:hypothetical protein